MADALNARGCPAIILLEEKDARAVEEIYDGTVPNLVSYTMPWWVKIWLRGSHRAPRLHRLAGFDKIFGFLGRRVWPAIMREHQVAFVHLSMTDSLTRLTTTPAIFEVTSPDWADRIGRRPRSVPQDMILHAVSESVHDRLRSQLPNREIIAAPIPFPNVDPMTALAPDIGAKENLIVFAHRLIGRKNGVLFARAARKFLARHPDWRIALRGEGPEADDISQILADDVAQGRAITGYTSGLRDELRRSRIFVSIIEPDNYPSQSVIEAMVHGNALLLSDKGRTREKFFSENGRMTPIDEDQIVRNLSDLVSDSVGLDAMGMRSHRLACERFSQSAYLDHLLAVYRKAGYDFGAR